MACLHVVNRPAALADCLAVAGPGDEILLIEDGVYAGVQVCERPLLAIDVDVQARGLNGRLHESVSEKSYSDFVELVTVHQPIVSWR